MGSREFREIEREWSARLRDSGFDDIEGRGGALKSKDRRTIAFDNRDRIQSFFLMLDHFMHAYEAMPAFDRRVMELYSSGVKITEIVKKLRAKRCNVRRCVARYKGIVRAVEILTLESQFPLSLEPPRISAPEAPDAARGSAGNRDPRSATDRP